MIHVSFLGALVLSLALAAGNFIFQTFQKNPNWKAAVNHSYYQAIALFIAWVIGLI